MSAGSDTSSNAAGVSADGPGSDELAGADPGAGELGVGPLLVGC
jgi:hypothetical protein